MDAEKHQKVKVIFQKAIVSNPKWKNCLQDHSLVQMLVDRGEMTEEEASQSSSSNIITQAINDSQKSATASIEVLNQVEHNDLFVLVSDGIL